MFRGRSAACSCWPHIAPYWDTIAAIPHIARYFSREVSTPPKWCDTLQVALALPTLAFLRKARETPQKSKGFLFAEPLNSLEKEGKTLKKKQGKSENKKSKDVEKSKDWRVRVVSQRHICAIPHFATYRTIIVRCTIKTSTTDLRCYRYKYRMI